MQSLRKRENWIRGYRMDWEEKFSIGIKGECIAAERTRVFSAVRSQLFQPTTQEGNNFDSPYLTQMPSFLFDQVIEKEKHFSECRCASRNRPFIPNPIFLDLFFPLWSTRIHRRHRYRFEANLKLWAQHHNLRDNVIVISLSISVGLISKHRRVGEDSRWTTLLDRDGYNNNHNRVSVDAASYSLDYSLLFSKIELYINPAVYTAAVLASPIGMAPSYLTCHNSH